MTKFSGFTLIEILISFFILAVIILSLNIIHVSNSRVTQTTYNFAIASAQLNVMTNILKTLNGGDNSEHFLMWSKQNKNVLPAGRGYIEGVFPNFVVTIFWGKQTDHSCERNRIGLSGCMSLKLKLT